MYLYDLGLGERISESYCFSSDGTNIAKQKIAFKVSNPSQDVILVFRITKELSGDITTWLERYAKGKAQKEEEKIKRDYRQLFGYTILKIFDSQGLGDVTQAGFERSVGTDWLLCQMDSKMNDAELYAAFVEHVHSKKARIVPIKFSLILTELETDKSDNSIR